MIGIEALRRAKEILGSQSAIADAVGISQPSVNHILGKGKRVPAEWCIPLERATAAKGEKIPRAAFRPDIYPDDPSHSRKPARSRQGFRVEQAARNPRRQAGAQ